jgi:hypothetical protein
MSLTVLGCLRACVARFGGGRRLLRVWVDVLGEGCCLSDDVDGLQFPLAGLDG